MICSDKCSGNGNVCTIQAEAMESQSEVTIEEIVLVGGTSTNLGDYTKQTLSRAALDM